jgi:ATP-binding cassette, subfamily B, bacterial HlyB/CyaB
MDDTFDYGPELKRPRKFPLVLQRDASDCAAACTAMICRYYGVKVPVAQFRNTIGVGAEGASMYGIARAANRVGLASRGVRIDADDLFAVRLPAIATQGHHFVVVYDVTQKWILLGDPEIGLRKVDHATFVRDWRQVLLLFNTTPAFFEQRAVPENRTLYREILRPYRGDLLLILSAALVLSALSLAVPFLMQVTIDGLLGSAEHDLFRPMAFAVVGVSIATLVAGGLRRHWSLVLAQKLEVDLGARFVRHLLSLSMRFFQSHRTGDALQRLQDVDQLKSFVSAQGIETLLNLALLGCFALVIFLYGVGWGIGFLLLAALAFWVARYTGERVNRELARALHYSATASTTLVESVRNIKTLKSQLAEAELSAKWERDIRFASAHQFTMGKLNNGFGMLLDFLFKAVPLLILLVGAREVIDGRLSVGRVVALISLFTIALEPMLNLSNGIVELQEVLLALRRVGDIFDTQPEGANERPSAGRVRRAIEGDIRFENVAFRYGNEDSPETLSGVSFGVAAGQRVALIGPSGSGKSTLAQLLNRLLEPQVGRILLDGRELSDYTLADLRRSISFVNQEAQLFSGTLLENIALGDPVPDLEKARAAAALAHADAFIRLLPAGYETVLSEEGGGLSAGQRQRVALARALYRDPRVLVLDEVTSLLDADSTAAVEAALPQICANRTVFIITHRLASIVSCDSILVLKAGTLIESGSHADLMKLDGLYARWQGGGALGFAPRSTEPAP